MATNIIINKLENKVFDDHVEAEKRLNELGINSDINSETYQNLADQVREACPCNCYFSKRKAYAVSVSYKGKSNRKEDTIFKSGNGGTVQMFHNYELEGNGSGYIEKGSTTGSIDVTGTISMRQEAAGQDFEEFDPGPNKACNSQNTTTGKTTFSIKLSDDCKHWIFSYNPVWFAGYVDEYSGECYTSVDEITTVFDNVKDNNNLSEEVYPEATTAFPTGTMKLVYTVNIDEDRPDSDPESTVYWHIFQNSELELSATVTPIDDNVNTLNSINSLYSDLDNSLK